MRVKLRPGANVDEALRLLETLAANIFNDAAPAGANYPGTLRTEYVQWVTIAERQMCALLWRPLVLETLETPRHRDICLMPEGRHLMISINAEIDSKAASLREMHEVLRTERDRMRRAPGCPSILDTNVLLQCLRPDQIKWRSVVGDQARLMLPLRVIEEIDAKKYGDSKRLRETARDVLPWIEGQFPTDSTSPVPLGDPDGSTLELLFPESPRHRPHDADEEILDDVQYVRSLAGRVHLVTADTGMLLRARALGISVAKIPDTYRRPAL